jgi:flagellar hook-basal body complex protein FliE
MATAAWIALGILLVALITSVSLALRSALRMWRNARTFSDTAQSALDDVMQSAAAAEEHSASLATNQERLDKATEHLQASLAQLAVLRAAADEVRAKFDRLRRVVPSK